MHFDPSNIQELGIGISAFLATLIFCFIVTTVWRDKVARSMGIVMLAIMVWSWFGFFYHLATDLELARALRIVSMLGIVSIAWTSLSFALVYLKESRPLVFWEAMSKRFAAAGAAVFATLLVGDFFGLRTVVGTLSSPPSEVLAPEAGPLLAPLIVYFVLAAVATGTIIFQRVRKEADAVRRRQALILMASITLGLLLGATRFAPWYGWDFAPLLGGLAFPLFAIAAFYAITAYNLFNIKVAIAELLVFLMWTFTFFRALVNPTLADAVPDIALLIASILIGIFLIRSILKEQRLAAELARLTVERAKAEFVTIAAHQLRTPVTGVRWILDELLASRTAAIGEAERSQLAKAKQSADAMLMVANDLLDVDRIATGHFTYSLEPGDVRDVVRVATGIFSDAASLKNIEVTSSLPPEIPPVVFDRGKLTIAVENILDNAIKYTPSGGRISVTVSTKGRHAIIVIADTGSGISSADLPRIFEKFFRGGQAVRIHPDGSGLGLFIAKTIIEGHGGAISVESEGTARGTTVTIELPLQ